ncbi:hypothetical protein FB451DRAFT_1509004 [Mycena latifolia]|nr:hypothetical protein FB451DRAFT_1509004 [Mycena latifolia]
MSAFTLKSLDASENPAPGSLSSLVFHVAFPEHVPGQFSARYEALRADRHLEDETHYDEASGRIALEAYLDDELRAERETWVKQATSAFDELVEANKETLRHVELILPTGGIATPLNLLSSVKKIAQLESFCVQWPLRGYRPLTLMLMSDWSHIIDDTITSAFTDFHTDLMDVLSAHAATLKRLRISLPQSTSRNPFAALSIKAAAFPVLPVLEVLDLTHWSPRVVDLKALLAPGGPLSALQHLIMDHGTEINRTDVDGHADDSDDDWDAPVVETRSWPALGAFLAAHPTPLRSLSAALHDARFSIGFAYRLRQSALRELLGAEATANLVVCTAWPISYETVEPGPGGEEREVDLYEHAAGCGHLAYPSDQRPTTGLWPAEGEEQRAMQTLAGRPWY